MNNSHEFLNLVLDSISDHIVVIDERGVIQYTNKSWKSYGTDNACSIGQDWHGINYLEECHKASDMGDQFGRESAQGIQNVIDRREEIFYLEYPCHSPDEQRWFMMRVTPLYHNKQRYFVICHQNITERKIAEAKVNDLAKIDGLTKIANRRAFDEFFSQEWLRCRRLNKPISLAILDLDYFKLLNDHYGHQKGDECLIRIGELLKGFAKRPGDQCSRYGGEEFVLVWSDTDLEQAKVLADRLIKDVLGLKLDNELSPIGPYLTASVGIAAITPKVGMKESDLIHLADKQLYLAKQQGRNQVSF